jgi:hypothetical protein
MIIRTCLLWSLGTNARTLATEEPENVLIKAMPFGRTLQSRSRARKRRPSSCPRPRERPSGSPPRASAARP